MAHITKQLLREHIAIGCARRSLLGLYEHDDATRAAAAMPDPHPAWLDMSALALAGRRWETTAVKTLRRIAGSSKVAAKGEEAEFEATPLLEALALDPAPLWVVEAALPRPSRPHGRAVETLERACADAGETCDWGAARADLVRIGPTRRDDRQIQADGTVGEAPTAARTIELIELKRANPPSSAALAEVAWYGWLCAAALADAGIDDTYVRAQVSVWGQGASSPRDIATEGGEAALRAQWASADAAVLLERLRRTIGKELPKLVAARAGAWREKVDWHFSRACATCAWLGPKRTDDDADAERPGCRRDARERDDIALIPGVDAGLARALRSTGVDTVRKACTLAATGADDSALMRSEAHRIAARANALHDGATSVVPGCGASASASPIAALHLDVHAEWDRETGMGAMLAWAGRAHIAREAPALSANAIVIAENITDEAQDSMVGRWLAGIDEWARGVDRARIQSGVASLPKGQLHAWSDEVAAYLEHRLRTLSPHVGRSGTMRAFLEEALFDRPTAGLHIISTDLERMLAAPLDVRIGLFRVNAALGRPGERRDARLARMGPEDIDDRVPARLVHYVVDNTRDATTRERRRQATRRLQAAGRAALGALRNAGIWIARNAERYAPGSGIEVPLCARMPSSVRLAPDLKRLVELELAERRAERAAMWARWLRPATEREASHDSILTTGALKGAERARAIAGAGLDDGEHVIVVRIAPGSRSARLHERDRRLVLIPENAADKAHIEVKKITARRRPRGLRPDDTVGAAYEVDVRLIDRANGWIVAIAPASGAEGRAWADEATGTRLADATDGDVGASLERWPSAWNERSLEASAAQIGYPALARSHRIAAPSPNALEAKGALTTAQALVWLPGSLGRTRESVGERDRIEGALGVLERTWALTERQREAVAHVQSERVAAVWGPPGTGKTHVLAGAVASRLKASAYRGAMLRVALVAPTWTATERLLSAVRERMEALDIETTGALSLRPERGGSARARIEAACVALAPGRAAPAIVAGTEWRIAALRNSAPEEGIADAAFDWITVDEASQATLATLVRIAPSLTEDGNLTLAGDPLQMPPVRHREPADTEERILNGSLYDFYCDRPDTTGGARAHQIAPVRLDTTFRASAAVTSAVRRAGYPALSSAVPERALALDRHAGDTPPDALIEALLAPRRGFVCAVHNEGNARGESPFEAALSADLATALAHRLRGFVDDDATVQGLRTPPETETLCATHLGIVAPHRAQCAAVRRAIEEALGTDAATDIAACVDTVERYQGGERTVIIVSPAVSDPSAIGREERFLMSIERMNVALSRARAKAILLIDRALLATLPRRAEHLRAAAYLRALSEGTGAHERYERSQGERTVRVSLRWFEPSQPGDHA